MLTNFAYSEDRHGKRIEACKASRVGRDQPFPSTGECWTQKVAQGCRWWEVEAMSDVAIGSRGVDWIKFCHKKSLQNWTCLHLCIFSTFGWYLLRMSHSKWHSGRFLCSRIEGGARKCLRSWLMVFKEKQGLWWKWKKLVILFPLREKGSRWWKLLEIASIIERKAENGCNNSARSWIKVRKWDTNCSYGNGW